MEQQDKLNMTVYAALLAALMGAGAFIAIPIGPVPIILQNFFVLLTGLLLGGRWGAASVSAYLLAGCLGLPVFAGGSGGIARFAGPTGGYLIGYLPAVAAVGFIADKGGRRFGYDLVAAIIGSVIVYLCGVPWLKMVTGMTWGKAVSLGMFPFLVGDALKIAAAVSAAKALRPFMADMVPSHAGESY